MPPLRAWTLGLLLVSTIFLTACLRETSLPVAIESNFSGTIYLYGETHGIASIFDNEYELWLAYYHDKKMRHLFIEFPYYTAELLNIWMKSDDDTILDEIFADIRGTAGDTPECKLFFQKIKQNAPETIFHGTDVGHQLNTGMRFLDYLEQNGQKDSLQYRIAEDNIAQREKYYYALGGNDDTYRENMMVKNFVRELNSIESQDIMGIYGSAHTQHSNRENNMATQLKAYFDKIHIFRLSQTMKLAVGERSESITIDGREYVANLIGWQDMSSWSEYYVSREYWRVDNAYESVKSNPKVDEVLPYNNYPMEIKIGDVLMIKYSKPDGGINIVFYRADGNIWNDLPVTERFEVKLNP